MRCRYMAGAIVCASRVRCATSTCRGEGTLLCDYPVTRRGRQTTCNRRICRGCAKPITSSTDYCPPHGRIHTAEQAARAEEDRFQMLMAEFQPFSPTHDGPEKA
jgi:hypothetical protein